MEAVNGIQRATRFSYLSLMLQYQPRRVSGQNLLVYRAFYPSHSSAFGSLFLLILRLELALFILVVAVITEVPHFCLDSTINFRTSDRDPR